MFTFVIIWLMMIVAIMRLNDTKVTLVMPCVMAVVLNEMCLKNSKD